MHRLEDSSIIQALRILLTTLLVWAAFVLLSASLFPHFPAAVHHVFVFLCFLSLSYLVHWGARGYQQDSQALNKARISFTDSLLQSVPGALAIFDANGEFLRWNERFENTFGYSRQQIERIRVSDLISSDDLDRVKRNIAKVSSLDSSDVEVSALHSNGSTIPFRFSHSLVFLEGKPCILALAVEGSAKKKAHDQLRLQATALRSVANGIVITKRDGTIEWVNPAFTEITGFSLDEVVGDNPRILKSGQHDQDFYKTMWGSISSGKVWRGEMTNRRKDGTLYVEEMTITPVRSDGGEVAHFVAVKNDITARRHAEDALRRAEEEYRNIFDQAVIGIFRSTPTGQLMMMNSAMAKMIGVGSSDQSREASPYKVEFIINRTGGRDLAAELEEKGVLRNIEHEMHREDGTKWLSFNVRCIYDPEGKPEYYEGTAEDITTRKAAETALQESEERLRLFVEHAPAALAMFDRDMCYVQASRRWMSDFGLGDREVRGVSHYELFPQLPEKWKEAHRRGLSGEVLREECDRFESNGIEYWVRWEIRPWHGANRDIGGIVIFAEDISERQLLENQLRQAQKMEAVGQLAGGVAHDFNNMLGVITGNVELLKLTSKLDKLTAQRVEQIHVAANKAASVTRQLLAFSRKQIVQRRVIDLNEIVFALESMLRQLIGENIKLIVHQSKQPACAIVDANQIDQVLLNLAVNARDAMPNGGNLVIDVDICELDSSYSMKHRPVSPGQYVRMTVSDNGTGMSKETMSHLFEPFFTTKSPGRGTGLGLSIVYGIVKQSKGYVWAYSEPGMGTSFKLYFPLKLEKAHSIAPSLIEHVRGTEGILIVEDDQALRMVEADFLKELGYDVMEADSGDSAIKIAVTNGTRIQVLITDMILPGMTGRELAAFLISKYPSLKVIYTSGYSHDRVFEAQPLQKEEAFLHKPLSLSELSRKLREILQKRSSDDNAQATATQD